MSPEISAIIIGLTQVCLTGVSAYLVDRSGRKLLLVVSWSVMCVTLVALGVYFKVNQLGEANSSAALSWLPIICVCLYLAGFSLGCGPLPWAMLGELLPGSIKGYCSSFVACFNWLLAFFVTVTFGGLVDALGGHAVFFIYAVICGTGVVFVLLFVIETKNKSLEQIQTELGANKSA